MRLAAAGYVVPGHPLREAFDASARLGLGQVDLWFARDPDEAAAGGALPFGQEGVRNLLSLMDEFGVGVAAMGGPLAGPIHAAGTARPRSVWPRFAALLEAASACGARVITLRADPVPARLPLMEALFCARRLLGPMVETAADYGVTVCLEPRPASPFRLPADAMLLLEVCPGLRLTYNPALFVAGGVPLLSTDALLDHTSHVRLCDAAPGGPFVAWGCGVVDPGWVLERLLYHRYGGAVTITYGAEEPLTDPLREAMRALGEIHAVLDRLVLL